MTDRGLKTFEELPTWEQKLRRNRETKQKEIAKDKKRQARCRFVIGELVGAVFPELLQADLSEGSVAYRAINAALVYLKEHPDVYRIL